MIETVFFDGDQGRRPGPGSSRAAWPRGHHGGNPRCRVLLTNGNSYPERSGLAGVFDIVVLAQDHGVSKPDRRLYDVAARQARVPEAGLAMIGDSLDHDVAGAQAAGWFGLWLDRDGAAPTAGVRPDATLRTLRDAPVALTGLAAR